MNPLAELLQCDSRLIRYAWDSRLGEYAIWRPMRLVSGAGP
jgi:hypothetical protein